MLNKKEKMVLVSIENYLFDINKSSMSIIGDTFMVNTGKVKDMKALDLYIKLYAINEKLKNKKDKNGDYLK